MNKNTSFEQKTFQKYIQVNILEIVRFVVVYSTTAAGSEVASINFVESKMASAMSTKKSHF